MRLARCTLIVLSELFQAENRNFLQRIGPLPRSRGTGSDRRWREGGRVPRIADHLPSPISGTALSMDGALWGELRHHINLPSLIFAKLPLDAFFRLRVVCKEWNRLASDRAFLLEHFSLMQPPFFVVDTRSGARLLRHDAGWTWTGLPPVKCESSGFLMEDSHGNRVFDLHTRMVHTLPDVVEDVVVEREPPLTVEEERDYEEPVVGMIVDATVKPHAFRVVLGDEVIPTRIYDSRSGLWTQKESIHEDLMLEPRSGRNVSAFCDGNLYIRVASVFNLHWYNVQRDEWSVSGYEVLPGYHMVIYQEAWPNGYERPSEWVFCDFGVWEDRLYLIGMNFDRPRNIQVWELTKFDWLYIHNFTDDEFDGKWRRVDRMPDDLWLWIFAGMEEKLKRSCWDKVFDMKSRFCGEYVLVYNSIACENFNEERAVLYNLNLKKWEKVDLPSSVV